MLEMAGSLSKKIGGVPPNTPSGPVTFSKWPVQPKVIENPKEE